MIHHCWLVDFTNYSVVKKKKKRRLIAIPRSSLWKREKVIWSEMWGMFIYSTFFWFYHMLLPHVRCSICWRYRWLHPLKYDFMSKGVKRANNFNNIQRFALLSCQQSFCSARGVSSFSNWQPSHFAWDPSHGIPIILEQFNQYWGTLSTLFKAGNQRTQILICDIIKSFCQWSQWQWMKDWLQC